MHIDFSTFCLISIPGFLAGIMAGKFIAGNRGKSLGNKLGSAWRILGALAYAGYFFCILITLGIMFIYVVNVGENPRPTSFWVTLLAGLWMIYNLIYELGGIIMRPKSQEQSG
ncbi:MAG: hypothetical protein U0V70_17935 [Terriglobia bacterium]